MSYRTDKNPHGDWVHISPKRDKWLHRLEGGPYCQCQCIPVVDYNRRVIYHSAFDNRDLFKEANQIINPKRESHR